MHLYKNIYFYTDFYIFIVLPFVNGGRPPINKRGEGLTKLQMLIFQEYAMLRNTIFYRYMLNTLEKILYFFLKYLFIIDIRDIYINIYMFNDPVMMVCCVAFSQCFKQSGNQNNTKIKQKRFEAVKIHNEMILPTYCKFQKVNKKKVW